jgi:hypothetical protein
LKRLPLPGASISGIVAHAMRKIIYPILVCLLACSCSATKGLQLSRDASMLFHSRMDRAQFEDIYRDSAAGPHGPQTLHDNFVALITRVHERMGTCGTGELATFQVTGNPIETVSYLSYVRRCQNGALYEDFQWQITDGQALLKSYLPRSGF